MIIADPTISEQNSFVGSATQQASSVTTITDPNAYEFSGGGYSVYGFEVRVVFFVHISAEDLMEIWTVQTRFRRWREYSYFYYY